MTTPPPSDRRFDADECIAVVVALAAIGGILFLGLRRVDPNFSWNMLETERTSDSDADSRTLMPFPPESTPRRNISAESSAPDSRAEIGVEEERRSPQTTQSSIATPPLSTPDAMAPSPTASPSAEVSASPQSSLPAPAAIPIPDVSFPDVSTDNWAYPFVAGLAAEGMVEGLQDGTFQPDAPMTRAQFASALQDVFDLGENRSSLAFSDISADYWANDAIDAAVKSDFMSGYPDNTFKPDQPMSRLEMLLALFSGLNLPPARDPGQVLSVYPDAAEIPGYAVPAIAAATEAKLIVLTPGQTQLQPNGIATRAEVASTLYQALVFQGQVKPIDSDAIVTP